MACQDRGGLVSEGRSWPTEIKSGHMGDTVHTGLNRSPNTATWSRHSRRIEPIVLSQYPSVTAITARLADPECSSPRRWRMKTADGVTVTNDVLCRYFPAIGLAELGRIHSAVGCAVTLSRRIWQRSCCKIGSPTMPVIVMTVTNASYDPMASAISPIRSMRPRTIAATGPACIAGGLCGFRRAGGLRGVTGTGSLALVVL
jgi:hypothetical protein